MNPKVSIVVPVYRVECYLERCTQSLVNQTLKEIEIILVDDGSPDKCPQMCDEYAKKDYRVKVVHKQNAGLGMACNSGIEVAIGDYIAFCDSDDYVDVKMYETMYKAALEHHADVVFTGIQTVDENEVVRPMSKPVQKAVLSQRKQIEAYLLDMVASKPSATNDRDIQMSAKVVLYKREMIEKYHLRFESERVFISEDLIWHIDVLAHASCVCLLPETFYYYYYNTTSLSKKVRTDRFPFFKSLRDEVLRRCHDYGISEGIKLRADRLFIGYTRMDLKKICKSKELSFRQKEEVLMRVCKDKVWIDILRNYPLQVMPFRHRIVMVFIKHRNYLLLNLLFRLSN